MAYSELVKRFDRVRDYMRDFLIFGFKTREDFGQKSARTYDNERRRIESWLGDGLRWEYRPGGKAVFLSVDASGLPSNPLYRAWQSKSFTDNDITLHFYLLDLLSDGRPRHAEEVTDELADRCERLFELSTVRRKLKEYGELGLLDMQKQGRRLCYALSPCSLDALFPDKTGLKEFLGFFGETAPLSVLGSFLAGRTGDGDAQIRFKHHFIVHTLEDQILLTILEALRAGRRLELTNVSGRDGRESVCRVVPVKLMVSVQSGRRYLVARRLDQRRFSTFRLDYIKALTPLPGQDGDENYRALAELRLAHAWGPALPGNERTQRFSMTVAVDEEHEPHIIQRLHREGRGGEVARLEPGLWRYTNEVHDVGEMMNWVKTFMGRIVALEGDDQRAIDRFYDDVRRMAGIYGGEV
ncbi:helix-turn-helix transcriptional regulator [Lawsonibacter faecis]|uniref:WYL domain-containing protein n=1 Tax=Lawsonibacter faecis TaxID=2763052 RepID=A0A8J6MBE8_9FIRM|nr:WYL domain-containing protein [Lawsonibacter faecis]MBC5735470.1 WYL domain-containing protein [Lawsonibacter faecis]